LIDTLSTAIKGVKLTALAAALPTLTRYLFDSPRRRQRHALSKLPILNAAFNQS